MPSPSLAEQTVTITLTVPASALRAVFGAAGLLPAPEATADPSLVDERAAAPDKLLSTREAAELLGVSTKHLEQMRGRGEGPPHRRIGRVVRYRRSDLLGAG